MAPDLNSLPPSRSTSSSPMYTRTTYPTAPAVDSHLHRRETPSPRSSSVSLAAAASINAADISRRSSSTGNNRGSPRAGRASERRRSQVAMNLNLNDPGLPSPGELSANDRRLSIGHSFSAASPSSIGGSTTIATGDPHHHRNPGLGEIHQELEQEQEAQVNRLLLMIRTQQLQLEQMQRYQQEHNARYPSQTTPTTSGTASNSNSTAVIDDSTPTSERSFSLPFTVPIQPQPLPRPIRRSSRPQSDGPSPALRPLGSAQEASHHSSSGEWPPSPIEIARRNSSRDESAYYQAEHATLMRENQMLRLRIRELERQINDLSSSQANTPSTPSNLATSLPIANPDRGAGTIGSGDADKD